MSFKKTFQWVFYTSFVLILLQFQNCSSSVSPYFEVNDLDGFKIVGGYGDGEGYEGKIGRFYRMIPNYTCDGKPVAYGELKFDQLGTSTIRLNSDNQCSDIDTPINLEAIESSPYNLDFLGYQDGLFERRKSAPQPQLENNFTEAWCRWKKSEGAGVDIAIRHSLLTNITESTIYVGEQVKQSLIAKKLPTTKVRRVITDDIVDYTAQGIHLKIDRSSFDGIQFGKFKGHLQINNKTLSVNRPVQCYLGGPLDPLINSVNVRGAVSPKLSPDQSTIVYYQNSSDGTFQLKSKNINNKQEYPLSDALLSSWQKLENGGARHNPYAIPQIEFTDDSKLVYYKGTLKDRPQENSWYRNSLWAVKVDGGKNILISNNKERILKNVYIMKDGRSLLYSSLDIGSRYSIYKGELNDTNRVEKDVIQHLRKTKAGIINYVKDENILITYSRQFIPRDTERENYNRFRFWAHFLDQGNNPVNITKAPLEMRSSRLITHLTGGSERHLIVQIENNVFDYEINTGKMKVLNDRTVLKASPFSAHYIVHSNDLEKWYVVDRNSAKQLPFPIGQYHRRFEFSKDGKYLYLLSSDEGFGELLRIDLVDLSVVSLSDSIDQADVLDFTVHEHSNLVGFWTRRSDDDFVELFTWKPFEGVNAVKYGRLFGGAKNGAYLESKLSHDGKKLLVLFNRSTSLFKSTLYLVYLDGLGKIRVSNKDLYTRDISKIETDDNFKNVIFNSSKGSSWIQF